MPNKPPQPGSTLGIALLGAGTVGGGVLDILNNNAANIRARSGGVNVEIAAVAVRNVAAARKRLPKQYAKLITGNWREAANNPRADIVVELMGGTTDAAQCIRQTLAKGKPVVTANKAALAECPGILNGDDGKPDVFFEAAVAGCVPVVKTLREALAGDAVSEVFGIVNGTCNYILSLMHGEDLAFGEALQSAGDNGYAEADPSLDIDGIDAAHKLALIARLAFGAQTQMADIPVEGVRNIDAQDIHYAAQLGFAIKLIARAAMHKGELSLSVRPTLIPESNMLAAVGGAMNAVVIRSANAGETMLYGAGAGAKPTATAVVADIIDIARGNFPPPPARKTKTKLASPDDGIAEYYLRLRAKDKPGVLADITSSLARGGISIEAIHQNEPRDSQTADITILTHRAARGGIIKHSRDIKKLRAVVGDIVMMPVLRDES